VHGPFVSAEVARPVSTPALEGDVEQGKRIRSEGVQELPQNWHQFGEGLPRRLLLQSPGGIAYTAELITVLQLMPVPG
jgi:hypothetical protein